MGNNVVYSVNILRRYTYRTYTNYTYMPTLLPMIFLRKYITHDKSCNSILYIKINRATYIG